MIQKFYNTNNNVVYYTNGRSSRVLTPISTKLFLFIRLTIRFTSRYGLTITDLSFIQNSILFASQRKFTSPLFMSAGLNKLDAQWEPTQIKVFSRWADSLLSEFGMHCEDCTKDFQDGVKLIKLVEIVTKKPITQRWNKNPDSKFKKGENCDLAVEILKQDFKVTNIAGSDIVDGNVKLTLGLIWQMILNFNVESVREEGTSTAVTATQALKRWCVKHTQEYEKVDNFKPTAYALCCLIHSFREDAIAIDALDPRDEQKCAETALAACRELTIPVYLDPQDLVGDVDDKSLMTQLAVMKKTLCAPPIPHKEFMLIINVDGKKQAVQAMFGENYLNSAGIRLGLADPDKSNPALLFTFGNREGGWITVIDSVKQRGLVWDVANADSEDPPEGTPFYLFPLHGRHNQRFEYRNKHIFACQNQHVVTYIGGENPFVMKKLDPEDRNQEFKLIYT